MKIWDAHVHLFPEKLQTAIFQWFSRNNWNIPHTNLKLKEYPEYLRTMGVEGAYLLTYAHKPNMSIELNKWVQDFCRQYAWFIPFACIHPGDHNIEENIRIVLDEWDFAGFKLQLPVQQFAANDPGLNAVYEGAHKRQKPVIIHAGTAPYSQSDPLIGLGHLEDTMNRWPELKVVIPHFGLYEEDTAISLVEKFPNVYLDTSWALGNPKENLPTDYLVYYMEKYPDKFLYGSDFPFIEQTPEEQLRVLLNMGLSKATLSKILYENARRLVHFA